MGILGEQMNILQLILRYPKIQKNFNNSNETLTPRLSRLLYGEGALDKTIGLIDKSELTRKPLVKIFENITEDNHTDWKTHISYNSAGFPNRYDIYMPAKFLIECFINSEIMNELEKSVNKNGIRELTLIIEAHSFCHKTDEGLLMIGSENQRESSNLTSEGVLRDIFW